MKKELKKGDVCVKVTDKNRENVKAILEMFGEEVYSNDTLINFEYIVYSVFSYAWNGALGPGKTIIKPKYLKAILAKEHLKEGDYVVLTDYVGVLKVDSMYEDTFDCCHDKGCFSTPFKLFKRYATPEEIELLEGKKDKFAELKEAHKNGATLQYFSDLHNTWKDVNNPIWSYGDKYRIKPEEQIKVGDVCKLWYDDDNRFYEVSSIIEIDTNSIPYLSNSGLFYANAKKVTKEEAIDLLFNKK